MALMPKVPVRYTIEDRTAFLATLEPDQQVDGEEYWGGLDALAVDQLWRDSETHEASRGSVGEQFYTVSQLAEIWQVSVRTVMRWIQLNRLKSIKIGGALRIRESSARAFENDNTEDDQQMFGRGDGA